MSYNTNIVIMNSRTRQNVSKALTNEYIADTYYDGALVFQRIDWMGTAGAFFAVPAADVRKEAASYEGSVRNVIHDTGLGNRDGGRAKLVGWVAKDGDKWGKVPTTSVPVYVFK